MEEGYNKILRYEFLANLVDMQKSKKIIDCACGDGFEGNVIIEKYKPEKYLCIDRDNDIVARCIENTKNNADYLVKDIRQLEIANEYDYFLCIETLEHLPKKDNEKVAQIIFDALKIKGKLLLTVPGNKEIAMECPGHKQNLANREKIILIFKNFNLIKEGKYIKNFDRPEAYSNCYVLKKKLCQI